MKNNYLSGNTCRAFLILLLTAFLNGCDRERNKPGWDYFPDMFYSAAYESYSPNPNFTDGMTMRVPVPGSVPRGYTPFDYTPDPESRKKAGMELVNPILPTTEVLARAKVIYTTFCIGCHGTTGAGDGHLFTSGLYPLKPRSLIGSEAVKLKDGEIFHTITLGLGSMGAHGSQIRPDDRWKLVLYIRKLQEEEEQKNKDMNGK